MDGYIQSFIKGKPLLPNKYNDQFEHPMYTRYLEFKTEINIPDFDSTRQYSYTEFFFMFHSLFESANHNVLLKAKALRTDLYTYTTNVKLKELFNIAFSNFQTTNTFYHHITIEAMHLELFETVPNFKIIDIINDIIKELSDYVMLNVGFSLLDNYMDTVRVVCRRYEILEERINTYFLKLKNIKNTIGTI